MRYVLLVILVLAVGVFGGAASDRVLSVITSDDREPQERLNTDTSEDFFGVYRAVL